MLTLSVGSRYFLYRQSCDMRKSFDSLSGLVRTQVGEDPLNGDVFIFFNTRRTQVKLLCWECDGFSIYYKRLEKGTYELPVTDEKSNSVEMSSDELMFILKGITLSSVRRRKRFDLNKNIFQSSSSPCFING